MGKTLKKKDQVKSDEKQTKISSFFENNGNEKKESKLFTKISATLRNPGRLALAKHTSPKVVYCEQEKPVKTVAVQKSGEQYITGQEQRVDRGQRGGTLVCIDLNEDSTGKPNASDSNNDILINTSDGESRVCEISNPSLRKLSNSNVSQPTGKTFRKSNSEGVLDTSILKPVSERNPLKSCDLPNSEQLVSSEKQGVNFPSTSFTTPEKLKTGKERFNTDADSSPDIICETPNVDCVFQTAETRRKKRAISSRSFLCKADLVAVQPGRKPAHLRVTQSRGGRKLLGRVSVSFNHNPGSKNTLIADREPQEELSHNMKELGKYVGNADTVKRTLDTVGNSANDSKNTRNQDHWTPEDSAKSMDCSNKLQEINEGDTNLSTVSIPESQFFEDIANEIVDEIESDTVSKASEFSFNDRYFERASAERTSSKTLEQQKKIGSGNEINTEKHSEESTTYSCTSNKALGTDVQREQKNIFASKTTSPIRMQAQTHNGNVLPGNKFERTKSKSKLINALEEADVKAEETEENLWMGERLLRHFAEDDRILDQVIQVENGVQITETTPVKKYDGTRLVVKRLSKAGTSPLSKRRSHEVSTDSKDVGMSDMLVTDDFNLNVISSLANAKRNLDIDNVPSPEPQPIKSKLTEQRAFQFGWKKKVKGHWDDKQITLEDDRLLTQLLGEISSSTSKAAQHSPSDVLKQLNPLPDKRIGTASLTKGNLSRGSKENSRFHKGLLTKLKPCDTELLDKLLGTDNPNLDIKVKALDLNEKNEAGNKSLDESEKLIAKKGTECSLHADKDEQMNAEEFITIMDSESTEVIGTYCENMQKPDCIVIDDDSEDFHTISHDTKSVSVISEQGGSKDSITKMFTMQTTDSTTEDKSLDSMQKITDRETFQAETVSLRSKLSDANLHTGCLPDAVKLSTDDCDVVYSDTKEVNVKADNSGSGNKKALNGRNNTGNWNHKEEDRNNASYHTTELSTSIYEMLSESFHDDPVNIIQFKKPEIKEKKFRFTDLWNRFTVLDVSQDRLKDETLLLLQCERTKKEYHCVLRGFWADTIVDKEDVVNIVGDIQGNVYTIDDRSGLIIVNPDLLLSGTLVVSSVFCQRKSVLNEKFKGVDAGNLHMLYGSIIHSLFQTVLKEHIMQEKAILQEAKALLKSPKFLHEMYSHNVEESLVLEEISQYVPTLISWLHKYTALSGSKKSGPIRGSDMLVTGICDIEENIWSPRLGLKGKIDMTVKVKQPKSEKSDAEKIIPLELKTGKASFSTEHKGQVTLYSMMYSDRREDPGEGILLYLKHGEMQTVPVRPESKSGLIQLRNQLAHYLTRQVDRETTVNGRQAFHLGRLPRPINNQRACSKCAHLLTCSTYQRSVEETVHTEKHAMATLVPETLQHLEQVDLDYFLHWTLCLDLEAQESRKSQLNQIWRSASLDREEKGDCISNLIITTSELGVPDSQSFNEGKGCSLTFARHPSHSGPPLLSVGLVCNDMVVISSEDGRYIALATGFIRSISQDLVEVVVDRDYLYDTSAYSNVRFRLDRNDSFSTSGYLYTTLARLMEATPRAKDLRDLIVHLQSPQFELKLSKSCIQKVKPVFKPLNKPQKMAILKVLMAKDYVLIKGFPGTGKTSTIVALVKILRLIGKSVLLTSYTHSAVDNILQKLKEDHVPFLRLGRRGRVHSSIHSHAAELLTSSPEINCVQKLKEFYESYDVVATSCLGINHPIFSQRKFDICIVDEASQVLQPACLGPLFHCDKFVLVGDPQQLPPLVQSKEASKHLGMDESLFARLDKCGATFELDLQYRMNKMIMDLSNHLVYEGKLKCGSPEVATACVKLNPRDTSEDPWWMKQVLSPDLEQSVVFLDTQQIGADETQDGKGVVNNGEAELVLTILEAAVAANVDPKSLGVMSPYRSQVRLIQRKLQNHGSLTNIEVNTVDQYQGRDKSVIIVSFVRSQNDSMGELLKDLRRLNVAFTRARHKLILIGNTQALKAYSYLSTVMTWLEWRGNIISLTLTR